MHIQLKDEARNEESGDKATVNPSKSVWSMDLQAVLLCPKSNASSLYYKTKLQVRNFTPYNMNTKNGFYCMWNETLEVFSSDAFDYLQLNHFEKFLTSNPDIKTLVIRSDGCGYQNRNVKVSCAYRLMAVKHKITVVQKFLIAGHTQMECDSMHSVIERKLVVDIYTD